EQALDSLLEARPLASQQRERDAPRADVVLVDAEAGHPQKSATVKQSLEAVGVAGVQQIQLVPTVGIGEQVFAAARPCRADEPPAESQPPGKSVRVAPQGHHTKLQAKAHDEGVSQPIRDVDSLRDHRWDSRSISGA